MRFLLDENLHESVAKSLRPLAELEGDAIDHILDHRDPGTPDIDIPPLCQGLGVDALFTANFKDFGARKVYYQALLKAGVSVVVVRPGKLRFTPAQQVALLARWSSRIRDLLSAASGPVLIRVTQSDIAERSLEELVAEFEAGRLP